ncbi:unnamed protein product [Staurois parvus]|uniref:Uncharacterized protein n=1 Tax=Staurois parvus TaxID=386267 RepID=A0ABN9GBI5_9NEOB|nr:unnamed protein product [Staurois parvus]
MLLNPGPWHPAFTISGLPQTLHPLYLVSHSTQNMEVQLF